MANLTAARMMTDGGGSVKKQKTNPYQQQSNVQTPDLAQAKSQPTWQSNLTKVQQKDQSAAAVSAQKSASYQQQSNVQTPDLVQAKSQPTWQDNLARVQQKAEVRKDAWALAEKKTRAKLLE